MKETWWVTPDPRAALDRVAPLDVSAWMEVAAVGRRLSSDRQSAAARLDTEPPLLVKWRRPLPGHWRRTILRPSRERREARAMLRARARGIPCPAPWAVGERRHLGALAGAVLVRPFDPDARTGAEALAEDAGALSALVGALRRWHDLGLRHGDCYPKNVLVGGSEDEPRPIGCPAARFLRAGPRLDRARLKDLGQWAAGLATEHEAEDPLAFLEDYACVPGVPGRGPLAAAVQPFLARVMARKARRLATRPAREPDGPPLPVPLSPGTARRVAVRDLPSLA